MFKFNGRSLANALGLGVGALVALKFLPQLLPATSGLGCWVITSVIIAFGLFQLGEAFGLDSLFDPSLGRRLNIGLERVINSITGCRLLALVALTATGLFVWMAASCLVAVGQLIASFTLPIDLPLTMVTLLGLLASVVGAMLSTVLAIVLLHRAILFAVVGWASLAAAMPFYQRDVLAKPEDDRSSHFGDWDFYQ
jgi:hypothetical protein